MKVLHLTTSLGGGAGIAARRLHQAMLSEGVDSRLLAASGESDDRSISFLPRWRGHTLRSLGEALDWRLFRSHLRLERGLFSRARRGISIAQHSWVQEADLIYLHWVVGGFLSLSSLEELFRLPKKFRWMMHDQWPMTGGCHHALECFHYRQECRHCPCFVSKKNSQKWAHVQWIAKEKIYSEAQLQWIAPSGWLAECARSSSLLKERRGAVIPNLIDIEIFAPRSQRELQQKFGLDSARRWALCFAMAGPYKGWKLFAEALRRLGPRDEWGVVLCGDQKLVDDLPSGWKTQFLPAIGDERLLAELYSAVDFLVIPSLMENYPNVAIEALASGTPIVATAVGGLPEIVERGGGLLSLPGDAASLANQLRRAFEGEISEARSDLIRQSHSAQAIVARHLALD